MMSLKYLCDYYFLLFNNQVVDKLSELLSDDVELIDWNVNTKGKLNVITEIQKIWNSPDNIIVLPNNYYEKDNTVCCEITILVNKNTKIEVVDILTFNKIMKIEKIKAYKI